MPRPTFRPGLPLGQPPFPIRCRRSLPVCRKQPGASSLLASSVVTQWIRSGRQTTTRCCKVNLTSKEGHTGTNTIGTRILQHQQGEVRETNAWSETFAGARLRAPITVRAHFTCIASHRQATEVRSGGHTSRGVFQQRHQVRSHHRLVQRVLHPCLPQFLP